MNGVGDRRFRSSVLCAAPVAWKDLIIVGTANGDSAEVCHVTALMQSSGKRLWSRRTVPYTSEPLAGTWQAAQHIAGGSMWTSFNINPATGKVYVPVGNPEPTSASEDPQAARSTATSRSGSQQNPRGSSSR